MNMKYQKLKIVVWRMWSDVQIEDTCGELVQISERWYSLYSEMTTCIFYVPRFTYGKETVFYFWYFILNAILFYN
jgi:hypothetical protein